MTMTQNRLVSIVLPTYSRSGYITRAVDSILAQTYQKWELIIVDDNDGDSEESRNTFSRMEPYLADKRIKYVKHIKNYHISQARNTGIEASSGEFIAFIDDDDEWYSQKIQKQLDTFDELGDRCGLVYSYYDRFDVDKNEVVTIKQNLSGYIFDKLGLNHIGTASLVMCRASVVHEIEGFDIEFKYREDLEFYYRIAKNYSVGLVKEPLIKYYIHSIGISRNHNLKLESLNMFKKKHLSTLKANKDVCNEMMERQGELEVVNGKVLQGAGTLFKSFLAEPTKIKRLVKAALAFSGKKMYSKVRGDL